MWLAAHWDRKLTKTEVYQTDIMESVGTLYFPPPSSIVVLLSPPKLHVSRLFLLWW